MTLFTCGIMEVVGQRFIFHESGAVYICVARYNEYVNFRMTMSYAFYSFYFHLTPYTSQLTCILFRYRSFAFVYYRADRQNLTALRRPRLLTQIDLLHSYRTGPRCLFVCLFDKLCYSNCCAAALLARRPSYIISRVYNVIDDRSEPY